MAARSKALAYAMQIRNNKIEQETKELLRPLKEEKTKTALSLQALRVLSEQIAQNHVSYQQDIEREFNDILKQIQRKKKHILTHLSIIKQSKLRKIQAHSQVLQQRQDSINSAIQTCTTIMDSNNEPQSTSTQWRQRVSAITDETLSKLPSHSSSKLSIKDRVQYTFHKHLLSSICSISDEDHTLHPLPNITDLQCQSVSAQSATISWNAALPSTVGSLRCTHPLYMMLNVFKSSNTNHHKVDHEDDEKTESNAPLLQSERILFTQKQSEYSYEIEDKLEPNSKYKVELNLVEELDDNTVINRGDFECISLVLQTKKAKKEKCATFRFERGRAENLSVSSDGLSVTGVGQIRFGDYLLAEDEQIYSVTFSMAAVTASECGIGFASTGYINTHPSHRMLVYGNGKTLMASEFKRGELSAAGVCWSEQDEVVVEINMKQRVGKMYRKYSGAQNITCVEEFYRVELPEVVAVCVRLSPRSKTDGKQPQTLTVVQQAFL
mmetsp:Transcript_50049/g.79719  ORF Transcript_50049/g.79719 Transcript_50049/m.79719 type:complete len:495 (+) Transcript_50049:27-1511(+)